MTISEIKKQKTKVTNTFRDKLQNNTEDTVQAEVKEHEVVTEVKAEVKKVDNK